MQLREVCEIEAGLEESKGWNDVDEIVENSRRKIFGNYPIFDEKYRPVLERKILKHFYMREIGFETVGLFKMKLNNKMNEIMPYYNKLYESELFEYNPLEDTNIKTERDRNGTRVENEGRKNVRNEENSSTNNNKNVNDVNRWELNNETPQGALTDVTSGRYLTDAINTQTNDVETSEGSASNIGNTETNDDRNKNVSDIEDYIETIKGKRGTKSYPQLIEEYRKTILNIDMQIIDELKLLFFLLW
jgi:hypothetical protein